MYVGRILNDATKWSLRQRFQKFGQIDDVELYFRHHRLGIVIKFWINLLNISWISITFNPRRLLCSPGLFNKKNINNTNKDKYTRLFMLTVYFFNPGTTTRSSPFMKPRTLITRSNTEMMGKSRSSMISASVEEDSFVRWSILISVSLCLNQ